MAKKLTKAKAREILHDKEVHGQPLTDKQRRFFGAIAGGAEPYKAQIGTILTGFHPNLAENLSEVLSAPQKAATQMITGKYQTPSEAMGIQNAAGAFLTDVVLDPLGLMGLGSAKRLGVLGKLDPRFKSKPGAYYRKIGDVEGVEDLRTSGVVRSKPLDPKVLEEYKRRNITHYPDPYFSVGKPIENYKGKYMLEYTGGTPFDTWDILGHEVGTPKGKIKIEDPGLKLYKKDWLRGYKEVKKTPKKKQDGGAIEGTMGGLTDKGFNFNPAWGGAWRDGGELTENNWLDKYQEGGVYPVTPYSREYVNNFRNQWIAHYNQPAPSMLRDDQFDDFFHRKQTEIPILSKPYTGWLKKFPDGSYEQREGNRDNPPKSMGKPAKGFEWVENFPTTPQRSKGDVGKLSTLIKSVRKAEEQKPEWNRAVRFADGGNLQPPMAGADQTVPMYAMGGSLPGSVGFTYARTAGAAPSEGPYAKKTLPSAQNGAEMSFYQQGLDWKPKTISKNGGWLDKFDDEVPQAQTGFLTQRYSTGPMMGDLATQSGIPTQSQIAQIEQNRRVVAAQKAVAKKQEDEARKQKASREAIERQGEIRPATPQSTGSRAWEILTNPVEAFGYTVRGERIPENFSKGESRSSGLNTVVNMINPLEMVDSGIDFVSDVNRIVSPLFPLGKNVTMEDFENAARGIIPAAAHALGALPLVSGMRAGIKTLDPVMTSTAKAWRATADLPTRTRLINALNTGALKARIPGDITSHSYFDMTPDAVKNAMLTEARDLPRSAMTLDLSMSKNSAPLFWNQAARSTDKGFTLVRPGTFQDVNMMGTQGKRIAEALPEEVRNLYPDIAKEHADRIVALREAGMLDRAAEVEKQGISSSWTQREILSKIRSTKDPLLQELYLKFLQNYKPTLDKGIEAVNRATNLNFPKTIIQNTSSGFRNNPYYEMPTVVAVKGNPLGRIPKSIANEWKGNTGYVNRALPGLSFINQEGDYINRKNFEDGGVVKDDMGYWNPQNWGKPVEINSNKITMEGVLEPLLGVSDTGDTKMMYPGKNYTFDGTKVVEYPREHFRAENGKSVNRADEYPLEKLDNLLNFTNYNKPKAKSGKWLDKYK
jgi:hypothetical protein